MHVIICPPTDKPYMPPFAENSIISTLSSCRPTLYLTTILFPGRRYPPRTQTTMASEIYQNVYSVNPKDFESLPISRSVSQSPMPSDSEDVRLRSDHKIRTDKLSLWDTNSVETEPQNPQNYQWRSKSSKRRVRKAIQKQKRNENKSHQRQSDGALSKGERAKPKPPMKSQDWSRNSLHLRETGFAVFESTGLVPSKRLIQWRERKLRRKTDPFSNCKGIWHHFTCGHRVITLCESCAQSWEDCHFQNHCISPLGKDRALYKFLAPFHYHFKRLCFKCEANGKSAPSGFRKPAYAHFPGEIWLKAGGNPKYVQKNEIRQDSHDNCAYYYILSYDKGVL